MNFRFKEIIRYIVPGLYIILQVFSYVNIVNFDGVIMFLKEQKDTGFVTFVLFSIPVVAYIFGYFIEIAASATEYNLYKFNIVKRASFIILNDRDKRYNICDLDGLYLKLNVSQEQINSNRDSKEVFDKVNQRLSDHSYSEEFFYQMMVARNMLTVQVIMSLVTLVLTIICIVSWWTVLISVVIASTLYYRWWQRSLSYTKHVFLQFINEN